MIPILASFNRKGKRDKSLHDIPSPFPVARDLKLNHKNADRSLRVTYMKKVTHIWREKTLSYFV
jgi:hypothetical protein